jgi:lipopolysaccharide/colanic/teichoic acid biosynthesis glycosyltransferase
MTHRNRSFTADWTWAFLDAGVLALVWVALHLLRFGHVPPFHRGPLGVIPALVGLQWVFGSYSALNDKQSGYRDHLQRYFVSAGCVIAWFVVGYAITGKSLDISIGQGFLLPLLFSGWISALILVWCESCRHFWQPQSRWLVMVSPPHRALLAREVEQGGFEIPVSLEWRPRVGSTSLPPQLSKLLKMDGVLLGPGGTLSDQDLTVLHLWQKEGVDLMPMLSWCERYLMRIPSELLPADPAELEWMFRRPHHRHQRRLKVLTEWLLALALFPLLVALTLTMALWRAVRRDQRRLLVRTTCMGFAGESFHQWRFASNPFPISALNALPQLWNVLRGEMALVGPRPVTPAVQDVLEARDPAFRLRLHLHPGMTGWGRLSGAASEEVDALRWELQRDLYYLCHLSFDLDLRILLRALFQSLFMLAGAR